MPLVRCTNVFYQGRLSRHITSPSEKTRPEPWPRPTWVRQPRSGSYYPSAATKCNERPSRATETPSVEKHAHPPRVVYCAIYSTLDSQSFEFEICILQALNMPLIRCTNIFFQGRLSRHITSPSEKTRSDSWHGDYMGKATPFWQLSSSNRYHQM